jgi:cytosine/adenosine deaminase-related metal-dependent hydrolase
MGFISKKAMLLANVNIPGRPGAKNILIRGDIIQCISDCEYSGITFEFNNATAIPGLINSHDHLEFNLFPPLKNRIYDNYTEWGKDIHLHNKKEIDKALQVPLPLRIQWGIYKNLLNGFTTVINHGKRLRVKDDLINVIQQTQTIHSVGFDKYWKWKLNNPVKIGLPVNIHVGEGKDEQAHAEINKLIRANFLKRKMVGIHAVAMDPEQAAHFKALVWCPASNYYMLEKTASIDSLKSRSNILFGSDSTLTSPWNIWEHFRAAKSTKMLNNAELLESITTKPALIWGLNGYGKLERNYKADILIIRNPENIFSTNPDDILLVIKNGKIILFDISLRQELDNMNQELNQNNFSKIRIKSSEKYVCGNLNLLIIEIKKYYPEAELPISI